MMRKKTDKRKDARVSELQKKKQEEINNSPVNRYLNAKGKDGKLKYSSAKGLRRYYLDNPDPILLDVRRINALLHTLRWRNKQATKYLMASRGDGVLEMKDKYGSIMDKADCYLTYVEYVQNQHITLADVRKCLAHELLPKCDDDVLSLEKFDVYAREVEALCSELGFVLFPEIVELMSPK